MGKKGFPEVLARLDTQGPMYYKDILVFALEEKLVKSRASIPGLVKGLYVWGLVDRKEIVNQRPIRTLYTISKRGRVILFHFRHVQAELERGAALD
jgi:hypothetical protein